MVAVSSVTLSELYVFPVLETFLSSHRIYGLNSAYFPVLLSKHVGPQDFSIFAKVVECVNYTYHFQIGIYFLAYRWIDYIQAALAADCFKIQALMYS